MTAHTDPTRSKSREDCDPDTPYAKKAAPEHGKPDQLRQEERHVEDRQEALIDESLEETFPASDPVSAKRIT